MYVSSASKSPVWVAFFCSSSHVHCAAMANDQAREKERSTRNAKLSDVDEVKGEVAQLRNVLDVTARLALQTAHRQQADSARRSLMLCVKPDASTTLQAKWLEWRRTSALPPNESPATRLIPWKEQVGSAILEYLASKTAMDEAAAAEVRALAMLPTALDAVSNQDSRQGDEAWPIVLVFRDSLLHDKFKPFLGKAHDMGVRPAQQQYRWCSTCCSPRTWPSSAQRRRKRQTWKASLPKA